MRKALCAVLAAVLSLSLTACGGGGMSGLDAADYIQGILDLNYLGILDEDYMASVDITKEEAQATYEHALEVEYEYFANYFDMKPEQLTEENHKAVVDLLADIYQSSSYQVKTATKSGDGYLVEIEVQPIDLIPLVVENYFEDFNEEYVASYNDVDFTAVQDDEAFWDGVENDWASGIVALFRAHESELGYLDAESIVVQVKPDEEGIYSLSNNDFANIDVLILAYSYR